MAEHGARVVISSRTQSACKAVVDEITSLQGAERAIAIEANISSKEELASLVTQTRTRLGRIDALVCNAASNPYYGPLDAMRVIGADEQTAVATGPPISRVPATTQCGYAILFGEFRLVPAARTLTRNGLPVQLGDRALDILIALVERAGQVVSNADLFRIVWPATFVEESNLRVQLSTLRRALGDGRSGRRFIVNVTGRGYAACERGVCQLEADFSAALREWLRRKAAQPALSRCRVSASRRFAHTWSRECRGTSPA
jgi:DNA-binding winged helix-turn-helix (wHTH) protein